MIKVNSNLCGKSVSLAPMIFDNNLKVTSVVSISCCWITKVMNLMSLCLHFN